MVSESVENVVYYQVDDRIVKALSKAGIEVMPIAEAWEKYEWVRKYVAKKPKFGYFIWVKQTTKVPVTTCVYVQSKEILQELENLVVLEPGVKAEAKTICSSLASGISAKHYSKGLIVLKEGSSYRVESVHNWHEGDEVDVKYTYVLERSSTLVYRFKSLNPASKMKSGVEVKLLEGAKADLEKVVDSKNAEITLEEFVELEGTGSSAVAKVRVVGRRDGHVEGITRMVGKAEVRGHLDCQGLIVDENAIIKLVPEMVVETKDALLTHEASIGKVNEEQLYYLMSRGLEEDEAVELIVEGFLE